MTDLGSDSGTGTDSGTCCANYAAIIKNSSAITSNYSTDCSSERRCAYAAY